MPVSKAFHGVVVVNDFLEPLMHIISDLMREKFSLHLIQFRVVLYVLSCFSASIEASFL